ncbi:hypothetical protein GCM10007907_17940 [Chitinimonas prasina]|uniref:Uncharacterized protein n=1 Tax=Chitinimonas prasina TaxID=1434937 RepID=A0ABQ5YJ81_9NEIS|nr:hypothetical protein GCM10007907_17940 [Chitinimonas prasina]
MEAAVGRPEAQERILSARMPTIRKPKHKKTKPRPTAMSARNFLPSRQKENPAPCMGIPSMVVWIQGTSNGTPA